MEVGKKNMILAEALMYREELEVRDGSDSEWDIEIKYQDCTRIFINWRVDPNGNISNIDPVVKDGLSVNKISWNKLPTLLFWKSRFVDNQGNDETTFGNKSISGLLRSSKPDHHKKLQKQTMDLEHKGDKGDIAK